jgi:hypothetical protein
MRKGSIVTKRKISNKELSTTYITVKRSELFISGNQMFVPASIMSIVFNSKGATRRFDSGNFIEHPTKGKMFQLKKEYNLERFITVVEG